MRGFRQKMQCMEQAMGRCRLVCPQMTQAEQMQRRQCKQCLMNCTAEQRGNCDIENNDKDFRKI